MSKKRSTEFQQDNRTEVKTFYTSIIKATVLVHLLMGRPLQTFNSQGRLVSYYLYQPITKAENFNIKKHKKIVKRRSATYTSKKNYENLCKRRIKVYYKSNITKV